MSDRRAPWLACAVCLIASAPAAGCNLLLTDWQVSEGGPSAGGGTTSSTSASGTGGGGGSPAQATPLESTALGPDVFVDGIAIHRQGHFRIEADPLSNWQWARWFYLPADPQAETPFGPVIYNSEDTPYYRTTCLWSAVRGRLDRGAGYSMRSCNYTHRQSESDFVGQPDLDDGALPVWFTLFGEVDAVWKAAVTFHTRVFASGRVWTHTRMVNNQRGLVGDVELGFGHIALQEDRFYLPAGDQEGLFEAKTGGGALLAVDPGSAPGAEWVSEITGLTDDGVIGIWEISKPLPLDAVEEFTFAFHLGPAVSLEAQREDRVSDLRGPEIELLEGATTMFGATGGFDPRTGTYTLDKILGRTSIRVALGGSMARFEPAFEITGWNSRSWVIRLGDEVLSTSEAQGTEMLATLARGRLVFQHLGVIEAGASLAARTFTISEN